MTTDARFGPDATTDPAAFAEVLARVPKGEITYLVDDGTGPRPCTADETAALRGAYASVCAMLDLTNRAYNRLVAAARGLRSPAVLATVVPAQVRADLALRGWGCAGRAYRTPDGWWRAQHGTEIWVWHHGAEDERTALVLTDTALGDYALRTRELLDVVASTSGESPAEVLALWLPADAEVPR